MKRSTLLIVLAILVLVGCRDAPEQLIPLPYEDLVSWMQKGQTPSFEKAVFKNMAGRTIPIDSVTNMMKSGQYFQDFYVNAKGEVLEVRIRKRTPKDDTLLNDLYNGVGNSEIVIRDVDCSNQRTLLEQVGMRAYLVRQNGIVTDFDANRQNLETVMSIIEKCGMPTLQEVDSTHMQILWEVFQYAAGQKYRKKYFHQLKAAALRGDLDLLDVASLEDRILASDGQPQRYGTYLVQNPETDLLELYQLEAPEQVDLRRAEIGLGPLRDSLERFGIAFEVPQQ
ncbi:MAG: DUF6624 domain-containing protein [Saprospiraceae bacterium]